jgi:hypothetical protein
MYILFGKSKMLKKEWAHKKFKALIINGQFRLFILFHTCSSYKPELEKM